MAREPMATTAAPRSVLPYLSCESVTAPRWLADGRGLAYLSNQAGHWEAYRVGAPDGDDGPRWPDRLTFVGDRVGDVRPLAGPGGGYLVAADRGGDERWRILRVRPGEAADLDGGDDLMRHLAAPSRDGRRFAFSSNRRAPNFFDVYVGDIDGDGEAPHLVWQKDALLYPLSFSPDGRYLLVQETRPSRDQALWLVPLDADARPAGQPRCLAEGPVGSVSQYQTPRWSSDSTVLYAATDAGREFSAVVAITVADGSERTLYAPVADVDEIDLSPDGSRIVLTENVGGRSALRVLDTAGGAQALLEPQGVITGPTWSPDGTRIAFVWDRADAGINLFVLDATGGTARAATRLALGGIDPKSLVGAEEVRVTARDGLEVPAFLLRPRTGTAPFPAVWIVHGGPESQSRDGFDPVAQFLVACGIAVVKPNVRGSTGYGRAYEHADDVRKRLDSVDDLADLWRALTGRGLLDPARQAVMGGSYGGFMTLSTLTRHPDLWRAGVDIVGIANMVTFLERTSPWRRPVREAEYGSLEHDREFLLEVSPISQVDRMTAALLVIHGARDPRVPVEESELIVSELTRRGRPVEYLRYEDEGHGLTKLANRRHAYDRVAGFLLERLAAN